MEPEFNLPTNFIDNYCMIYANAPSDSKVTDGNGISGQITIQYQNIHRNLQKFLVINHVNQY